MEYTLLNAIIVPSSPRANPRPYYKGVSAEDFILDGVVLETQYFRIGVDYDLPYRCS